ncbi:Endonuclease/exonuclease/phosphatase [Pyronema domesticum]|nr:Endonuclease/exonuclease/phosphatase [Pyronema domesticum]
MAIMETGVRRKVDVILIQEPPMSETYRHPEYEYLRMGVGMMMARRVDSEWRFSMEDRLVQGAEGDVQVLSIGKRGYIGTEVCIVNVYNQKRTPEDNERPARIADWDAILADAEVILVGDFNAHSSRWNPHCPNRREGHEFLEHLIDEYSLAVRNDGLATRRPDGDREARPIIIDLTLVSPL